MKAICTFTLALAVLLAAGVPATAVFAGEPLTDIYVAAREFVVTVSPVDEESKNAENSDLFQRSSKEGEWTNLGRCKKTTLPNGEVRFLKTVKVDNDGVFQYTSRPVVGGTVNATPDRNSPPQATVIVDTLAPVVEITKPSENVHLTAGDSLDIAWTVHDENLAERPVDIAWSADGGVTWITLAEGVAAIGEMTWKIPEDVSGPASLRAVAVDKAGNRGDVRRQLEIAKRLPTPVKPAITEPEAPVTTSPTTPTTPSSSPVEITGKSVTSHVEKAKPTRNRSWLYYLMAVNLMRQEKPKDALQYYWLAVKADPEFIDAWADIALAYIDVGAYRTAREIVEQTRDRDPERIDLMHLMGETYHAEAMDLLGRAKSTEDRISAKALIDVAVNWYGMALEKAAEEWRLAERAASYYRLGEICYYVNMDREGARAYWMKILDLHSPTPNPDLVLWSPPEEREYARNNYQRQIYQRVSLESWQNWARGYIQQLDERERKGIADLMPANRINRHTPSLASGSGEYSPGRPDGKSLFSLPNQYGTPDPVAASVGVAPNAMSYQSPPAADYNFFAPKGRDSGPEKAPAKNPNRNKRSTFSGGPDIPIPQPADPYDFPKGNQKRGDWYTSGTYGDKPVESW